MKTHILPFLLLIGAFGCAKFGTNVFRTEQTTVNLAHAAYVGYTNGLYSGAIHVTTTQSNEIRQARLRLAGSVATLDGWRVAYETNSAVKPQVQAALDAVLQDSSGLLYLVNLYKQ